MEKQEIWKPVVGYEDFYEVSNLGRVKSLHRGKERILKPSSERGYFRVDLSKNGKKEHCQVHQLVMESFVGRCPDGCEVDHIDWNPENNMLDNLRYIPKKENSGRHSEEWRNAVIKRSQNQEWRKNQTEAVRKANSKPIDQFTLDGLFVKTWESAREIERELGLAKSNFSKCCKGKRKTAGGFIWRFAVCLT